MKTVAKRRRISVSVSGVSGVSGPPAVSTIAIPISPKAIEAPINTRVAIFCIERV